MLLSDPPQAFLAVSHLTPPSHVFIIWPPLILIFSFQLCCPIAIFPISSSSSSPFTVKIKELVAGGDFVLYLITCMSGKGQ